MCVENALTISLAHMQTATKKQAWLAHLNYVLSLYNSHADIPTAPEAPV